MNKNNKPACFSTKIDVKLKDKIKEDLKNMDFQFSQPQYTIFSAKKKGVVVVLYESGKLLVQGKEKDSFIEFYLEPEILKNFKYTYPEAHLDKTERIGVDEAGKGDFFGPLCIAAVHATNENIKGLLDLNVRDSKNISDKTILKIGKEIKDKYEHTLIRIFPEKYNELYIKFKNLNSLLGWAHATAIDKLVKKTNCKNVLIDQFADKKVVSSAIKQKNLEIDLKQRHRAEEDIVVAAASILARYAFLEGMKVLSEELDIELPKGASQKVIEIGKKIVLKFGPEKLEQVAKIHFKTHKEITS